MYKVIIADDDFLVRTYLKQMIDWKANGFTIVGDAKNGREALRLIEQEKPALIITDICMPVLDGIGLIRELRARKLPGHILVLSGHDDFAYVHEAMKLGIDDYLLKDDLTPENILHFLQEHLQGEEEGQELPVSQEELAAIGKAKLQEDFFAAFCQGSLTEAELPLAAKRAGLPEAFSFAAACQLTLRGWQARRKQFTDEDLASFQQAFHEMCQTFLAHQQPEVFGQSFPVQAEAGRWGLLLFFPHAVSQAAILQRLQALCQKLSVLTKRYFDLPLVLVLSAPQANLFALQEAWQVMAACAEALFYVEPGIYRVEDLPALQQTASFAADAADLPAEALCEQLAKTPLTRQARITVLRQRFADGDAAKLPVLTDAEALPDFLTALRAAIEAVQSARQLHPSVRQALAILEARYRENLTQAEVAAAVHLNPAYFSTLFKKNMGKGFREYLAELRITAVKKHLRSSTERIKDIAAAEGFDDYPYFCRLFKSLVGQTPQEYRAKP